MHIFFLNISSKWIINIKKIAKYLLFSISTISIPSSSAEFSAAFLKSHLKRWFPHSPQHGQPATVSFVSTSICRNLFSSSLLGLLTILVSDLGFSLPGILQMTENLLDRNIAKLSFALHKYGLRKMEVVNRVLPLECYH